MFVGQMEASRSRLGLSGELAGAALLHVSLSLLLGHCVRACMFLCQWWKSKRASSITHVHVNVLNSGGWCHISPTSVLLFKALHTWMNSKSRRGEMFSLSLLKELQSRGIVPLTESTISVITYFHTLDGIK